ncbi:MAG: tetratricopeptide repeat protein [Paramuribaculum sp.]|nr:tetratricopeptide repeat protein [Paramuribaculum sp.]
MKRFIAISCVGAATLLAALNAAGQATSWRAPGYLTRGVAMYDHTLYNGSIDQLSHLPQLHPDASEQERGLYYMAMSTLYSGDDESLDLLRQYLRLYPQSPLTESVKASIGDYHFTRAAYGDAIGAYLAVDRDALTSTAADDVAYRLAYSYMMLGENDAAANLFNGLLNSGKYADAARFYRGYMAYQAGNFAEARRWMEQVDPKSEPGAAVPYYVAQMDYIDGKWKDAYEGARKALTADAIAAFRPELLRIAGESLFQMGESREAISYLRRYIAACNAEDVRPTTYYILGMSEYDQDNFTDAIPLFQRASSESNAMGQNAALYLGQAYVRTGDREAAALAFDKARSMKYDDAVTESAAYNYLVTRLDGNRMPFTATSAMMEDFVRTYPRGNHADRVRESLVDGYLADDQYDRALELISQISNPSAHVKATHARLLLLQGSKLYRNGEVSASLDNFKKAAAMRGAEKEVALQAMLWKAMALYDLGGNEEAVEAYKAFINGAPANDPNLLQAYYGLGYSQKETGNGDAAIGSFRKVASNSQAPATMRADALNRIADIQLEAGRLTDAAASYQSAYEALPETGDYAIYQQGMVNGYLRRNDSKAQSMNLLLTKFPTSAYAPAALLAKADAATALGNPDDASKAYRRLLTDYPATSQAREAMLMLAVSDLNAGRRGQAVKGLCEVVSNYPTSTEARSAISYLKTLYAEEGRLPELTSFLASVPDAPQIDISEAETQAFAAAQDSYDSTGSTALLATYVEQYPAGADVAEALLILASESMDNGDTRTAAKYAEQLVATAPDTPQAEEGMLIKGEAEESLGKGEMALASYKALAEMTADASLATSANLGLMRTAMDLGRYNDVLSATAWLMQSTSALAELDNVKYSRAVALNRTGDTGGAIALWTELSANPSVLAGSMSAVALAEAQLAQGDKDSAAATAKAFLDAGSPYNYWTARGFIVYTDALRAQGKTFEAEEYLRVLKENYPGQEPEIFQMIETRLNPEE